MGFEHFRVSKAGAIFNHASIGKRTVQARASGDCLSGGFYKTPTTSSTINALYPLNITWDPTCLTPANDKADIYLFAPNLENPRLHLWSGVTFSEGSYNTTIKPRWWNATSSQSLQLLILQHGDAPFMATLPAGPVFTATYSAPSSGETPDIADISKSSSDTGVTKVDASPAETPSSHKGKIAAAVLVPLLVLIGLGVLAYFKLSRARGKEKRRTFAENVDKRMSTISTNWQSMSAAGAQAAIRNSMAVGEGGGAGANPRASSFSFGAIRPPSSVYPADGGHAGVGATAGGGGAYASSPEMVQQRSPGVGLRSTAYSNSLATTRVSRVSFADSPVPRPRPSGESRRSAYERRSQAGQSRAFHYSGDESSSFPPMPEGAAERASMFVGGINPALVRGGGGGGGNLNPSLSGFMPAGNHSSTTINTTGHGGSSPSLSASASRLSRFEEVYGGGGGSDDVDVAAAAVAVGDNSFDSYLAGINGQDARASSAKLDSMYAAYGAYAYDGEEPVQTPGDGVMSPKQRTGPMALREEDVGPALTMMRAQDQDEDLALAHSNAQAYSIALGQSNLGPSRLPSFPTPVHYDYAMSPNGGSGGAYYSTDRNETLFTASPVAEAFPAINGTGSFGQAMEMSESPIASSFSQSGSGYFPSMSTPGTTTTTTETTGGGVVAAMSPDDMLRMYAERNRAGSRSGGVKSPLSRSTTPATSGSGSGSSVVVGRKASVDTNLAGRVVVTPAAPGVYSPARGAYGVSGLDD
ncbi:hypothetical protein K435DRAFT_879686 [Dendrothele bispora CBS 962.96]|uniref:Uncharacterized protein n=1 Tax=Dendrothele bispora (strain CBS 962.96) TaxID=1314807 RepID=A0A4V4HAN7_DENBC|nr:hypothetical protein K435DRAFT_879686 [Dendrothele bispora CBS 962.96]